MNRAGGYISVAENCTKINAIIKLDLFFLILKIYKSVVFIVFLNNKECFYRSLLINTVFFEVDFQRDRSTLLQKSLQEQVDSNGGSEGERRKSVESEPQSAATRLIYCRGIKNDIFTFKIKKAFLSFFFSVATNSKSTFKNALKGEVLMKLYDSSWN